MKYCIYCGAQAQDDAAFCVRCGRGFATDAQPAQPVQPVQPVQPPKPAEPPKPAARPDPELDKKLAAYKDLLDCGILSREEYDRKVSKLTGGNG